MRKSLAILSIALCSFGAGLFLGKRFSENRKKEAIENQVDGALLLLAGAMREEGVILTISGKNGPEKVRLKAEKIELKKPLSPFYKFPSLNRGAR